MAQAFTEFRTDAPPEKVPAVAAAQVTRALLTCGVVAGPLFLVVVIAQALIRPGFDVGRHPISLLSLGDLGWIQIANFIGSGLLTLAFAVGVRRALKGGLADTWGPLLIGMFGIGLVVAGLFVPTARLGSLLGRLFADCEVGAIPPFGNVYGLDVYVDRTIAQNEHIEFRAGMHSETLRMKCADFERLVQPHIIDVARHH